MRTGFLNVALAHAGDLQMDVDIARQRAQGLARNEQTFDKDKWMITYQLSLTLLVGLQPTCCFQKYGCIQGMEKFPLFQV